MTNPNFKIELSIVQERLRQAQWSFNLALVAIAVSIFISLTGAGFLLTGRVNEGAVTAASGLITSIRYVQLAKDANDRLDRILPVKK